MNHDIFVTYNINLCYRVEETVTPLHFLECSTESELYDAGYNYLLDAESAYCREGNVENSEIEFTLPDSFINEWRMLRKERYGVPM